MAITRLLHHSPRGTINPEQHHRWGKKIIVSLKIIALILVIYVVTAKPLYNRPVGKHYTCSDNDHNASEHIVNARQLDTSLAQNHGDVGARSSSTTERPLGAPPYRTWQSRRCPIPRPPGSTPWFHVFSSCFIFAAHLDDRPSPRVVRVIGSHRTGGRGPNKCTFIYPDTKEMDIVDTMVKMNPENHDLRFSAYIYTCSIPSKRKKPPCGVKLRYNFVSEMEDFLWITRPSPVEKVNYTVCVPALFNYTNVHQLVDTIETNRFFGANHYIIYNTTSSAEVAKYLVYYKEIRLVTVIPWKMPEMLEKGLHYHGQLVTVQDCYYRARINSRYVVFMDLDEVIVPRHLGTRGSPSTSSTFSPSSRWDTMLKAALLPPSSRAAASPAVTSDIAVGAFMFRSKFFGICNTTNFPVTQEIPPTDMDWKTIDTSILWQELTNGSTWRRELTDMSTWWRKLAEQLHMNTLLYRAAQKEPFPFRIRSKMIVSSGGALNVGIHFVYEYLPGYAEVDVDPTVGLVHHYRMMMGCSTDSRHDGYMEQFAPELVARVKGVHDHVINRGRS